MSAGAVGNRHHRHHHHLKIPRTALENVVEQNIFQRGIRLRGATYFIFQETPEERSFEPPAKKARLEVQEINSDDDDKAKPSYSMFKKTYKSQFNLWIYR